jgi:hypothetical protein
MQFTIRDLLWLTTVAAFAVLWFGEIRQRKFENAEVWADNLRLRDERNSAVMAMGHVTARIHELEQRGNRVDASMPGNVRHDRVPSL